MRIAIDIDGFLTMESEGHDYLIRTPNKDNIERVNQLRKTGCFILLFTSRFEEDRFITLDWLKEHGVEFDEVVFGKPKVDCYVDDISLPYIEPFLLRYLNYDFSSCWRAKNSTVYSGEQHPCFFCGHDIDVKTQKCYRCDIMICPTCHKCFCNISILTKITLARAHEKYCVFLDKFEGEVSLDGFVDLNVISNFKEAISYCAFQEGFIHE